MVKKGTYNVQDPEGQPAAQDTSYKSFLCVLLIFIAFCVLIIVFSSVDWFKKKEKEPLGLNENSEMFDKEKYVREKEQQANNSKKSDKPQSNEDNEDYLEYTNEKEKEVLETHKPEVTTILSTTETDRQITGKTKGFTEDKVTTEVIYNKANLTNVYNESKENTTTINDKGSDVSSTTAISTTFISSTFNTTSSTTTPASSQASSSTSTSTTPASTSTSSSTSTSTTPASTSTTSSTSTSTTLGSTSTSSSTFISTTPTSTSTSSSTSTSTTLGSTSTTSSTSTSTSTTSSTSTSTTPASISTTSSTSSSTTSTSTTPAFISTTSSTSSSTTSTSTTPASISTTSSTSSSTTPASIPVLGIDSSTTNTTYSSTTFSPSSTTFSSLTSTSPIPMPPLLNITSSSTTTPTTTTSTIPSSTTTSTTTTSTTPSPTTTSTTTTSTTPSSTTTSTTTTSTTPSSTTTSSPLSLSSTTPNFVTTSIASSSAKPSTQSTSTTAKSISSSTSLAPNPLTFTSTTPSSVISSTTESTTMASTVIMTEETIMQTTTEASPKTTPKLTQNLNGEDEEEEDDDDESENPSEASPEDQYSSGEKMSPTSSSNSPPLGSTNTLISTSSTSSTTATPSTSTVTALTNTKSSVSNPTALTRMRNKLKITVSNMLGLMDHTIDMCEDFYLYSCKRATKQSSTMFKKQSGFRKRLNEEIKSRNVSSSSFRDKMIRFYNICVRHEALFDYQERLNQVKEIVGKLVNDNPTKDDLTILVAEMILTNTLPIFDVDIDVDKNSEYIFKLSPPYKSLTRNQMESNSALYNSDSNCAKLLLREQRFDPHDLNLDQIYEDFTNCTKDFNNYLLSFNVTKKAIDFLNKVPNLEFFVENQVLDSLKNFNTTLIRDSWLNRNYKIQTLENLEKVYMNVNWKLLFKILSGKDMVDSSQVFVYEIDILYQIFQELAVIKETYRNLLAIYTHDLFQMSVVPIAVDTRDKFCSNLVDYLFPDVSSYLYLKDLTQEKILDSQELANKVFKILKNDLLTNVDNSNTITDDDPKTEIKQRISNLSLLFMDTSDECISEKSLSIKYQSVILKPNYIFSYVEMKKLKNSVKFSLVGKNFNDSDIFCHFIQPQDLKPKSFYMSSKIAIPYEYLSPWSMDYPDYFLMAKVGTLIAIEMGKLFNKIGLSYIANNTEVLEGLHSEITQDVVNINNRTVSLTASDVKNIQSVGDNAGFKLAYKSYNQLVTNNTRLPWIENSPDFTDNRTFFIAAAQEFCEEGNHLDFMLKMYEGDTFPNYWRVNNMIINTKEFRKVFDCKVGSKMVPNGASHLAFPEVSGEDDY